MFYRSARSDRIGELKQEVYVYRSIRLVSLSIAINIFSSLISAQQPIPLKVKTIPADPANAYFKKDAKKISGNAPLAASADPFLLNELAAKLSSDGKFLESAEKLEAAVRLAPDIAGSHVNLSIAYEHLGRLEDSLRSAQTASTLTPDSPRAYWQLCGVLFQLNRFEEAIDCYGKLVKLTPDDNAESRTLLGTAMVRAGHSDQALVILRQVTNSFPLYARAYNATGVALYNKKKYTEAAKAFKRAVEINPNSSLFRFNLGIAQAVNRNTAGALSQYRALQELDPKRALMIYKLVYRDKLVFVSDQKDRK